MTVVQNIARTHSPPFASKQETVYNTSNEPVDLVTCKIITCVGGVQVAMPT